MTESTIAASIAVALAFTTLSAEVSARGFSGHVPHQAFWHRSHNALVVVYPLGNEPKVFLPPQAAAPRCTHSREIVTEPSEEGGTREIVITRC
jgi:hypothetical protein